MAMALVWHDAKSFRRHLEQMRAFRQSHHNNPGVSLSWLRDILAPDCFLSKSGKARGFIMRGKSTLVPIWEITPSRNSQN
jgi:hypothetical protein